MNQDENPAIAMKNKLLRLKNYKRNKEQSVRQKENWKKYRFNYQAGIHSFNRRKTVLKRSPTLLNRMIKAKKAKVDRRIEMENSREIVSEMLMLLSEITAANYRENFHTLDDLAESQLLEEALMPCVMESCATLLSEGYIDEHNMELVLCLLESDLMEQMPESYILEHDYTLTEAFMSL